MLATQEKALIETALAEARGQVSGPTGAAAKLSMRPSTLESKIRTLKINKHRFKAPREPLHRLIDSGTKESVELRMRR
jgi:DNA-binding NtrC family response regulator